MHPDRAKAVAGEPGGGLLRFGVMDPTVELDQMLLRLNQLAHVEGRSSVRSAYLAAAARVIEAMAALAAADRDPPPLPPRRRRRRTR